MHFTPRFPAHLLLFWEEGLRVLLPSFLFSLLPWSAWASSQYPSPWVTLLIMSKWGGDEVNVLLSRLLVRRLRRHPCGVEVRLPEAPGNPEEASFPHGVSVTRHGRRRRELILRAARPAPAANTWLCRPQAARKATPKTHLTQFVGKAAVSFGPDARPAAGRGCACACACAVSAELAREDPRAVSLLPSCEQRFRARGCDGACPPYSVDDTSDPGPFLCWSRLGVLAGLERNVVKTKLAAKMRVGNAGPARRLWGRRPFPGAWLARPSPGRWRRVCVGRSLQDAPADGAAGRFWRKMV